METTMEELRDAVRLASADVLAFLRSEPNVHALIPGGGSTVRDLAVHLIAGTRMYAVTLDSQRYPLKGFRDIAPWRMGAVFALDEDRPKVLADLFERAVDCFLTDVERHGRDDPCPYYAELGGRTTIGTLTGALVFDYLLNGADMAVAVGRDRAVVESAADAAFPFAVPLVLPLGFAPKAAGDLDARFALVSSGGRLCYQVHSGTIERLSDDARTDCSISGPSSQWLLWVTGRADWQDSAMSISGERADVAPRFVASFPARNV